MLTDADKADFAARIKRAQADAAKRKLRLTGYRYQEGRLSFDYAPLKAERAKDPEPRSRRGVAGQGSLL